MVSGSLITPVGQAGARGLALPGFHGENASSVVSGRWSLTEVRLIRYFIARSSELMGNFGGIHTTATIHPQVENEWLNKVRHFLSTFTSKGTLPLVGRCLKLEMNMLAIIMLLSLGQLSFPLRETEERWFC